MHGNMEDGEAGGWVVGIHKEATVEEMLQSAVNLESAGRISDAASAYERAVQATSRRNPGLS